MKLKVGILPVLVGKISYNLRKPAFFGLILVIIAFGFLSVAPVHSADDTDTYGVSWGSEGLGALEIGSMEGRKLSIRFQAEQTGKIDRFLIYLKDQSFPYYSGDGGQVLAQIQTDDGTAEHLPSGTVLASHLITEPLKEPWNTTVTLDNTVDLVEGNIYHIVLTDPVADPVNNYLSLNNLHSTVAANEQPGFQSYAVLRKRDAAAPWTEMGAYLPIFGVHFTDGFMQGQGYIDALSVSGEKTISGNSMVRSAFTVSSEDRLVSKVFVWVKKTSGVSGLSVRLEASAGVLMEEGIIPASSIGNTEGWVAYTFKTPHLLSSGSSYYLTLSAPSSDMYSTYPIQDGIVNGFPATNVFQDEHWEYNNGDNSWQSLPGSSAFHMQSCFGEVTTGLVLTKSVDKSSAQSGDLLTYTVNYSNPTVNTFYNAKIEDPIPVGTTFESIISGGATFDANASKIVLNIGNLSPSATGVISFRVRVN